MGQLDRRDFGNADPLQEVGGVGGNPRPFSVQQLAGRAELQVPGKSGLLYQEMKLDEYQRASLRKLPQLTTLVQTGRSFLL